MPRPEFIGDDVIIRGVPVFDEHEDASQPKLKRVDEEVLRGIVAATEKRIADTEGELPLGLGIHTPKKGELHAPPPVVGGYRNLRIGTIGSVNPRKAILADFRIPKENWPAVQSYQRRSVEIFPGTLELDTIALLGSKAPARDLGPMTATAHYNRTDAGSVIRYEMGADEESTMDDAKPAGLSAEDIQTLTAAVSSSIADVIKASMKEVLDDLLGDETPDAEDQEVVEEPSPDVTDEAKAESAETEDEDEDKQMYAKVGKRARDAEIARYERRLAESDAKFAEVQKQVSEMRTRETMARYERDLAAVANEGYLLEVADELKEMMAMPNDSARDAHIARIRKNYKKAPINGFSRANGLHYERGDEPDLFGSGDQQEKSAKTARSIESYARQHKVDFFTARDAVLNGKSGK